MLKEIASKAHAQSARASEFERSRAWFKRAMKREARNARAREARARACFEARVVALELFEFLKLTKSQMIVSCAQIPCL